MRVVARANSGARVTVTFTVGLPAAGGTATVATLGGMVAGAADGATAADATATVATVLDDVLVAAGASGAAVTLTASTLRVWSPTGAAESVALWPARTGTSTVVVTPVGGGAGSSPSPSGAGASADNAEVFPVLKSVAVADTTWPSGMGSTTAVKSAGPLPSVVTASEPRSFSPSPTGRPSCRAKKSIRKLVFASPDREPLTAVPPADVSTGALGA
jgi:hypothetical protein